MKLRDLIAGGLLAALLVACSAASPATPDANTGNLNATAAAGVDAASTAVPGIDATVAAGVDTASTAVPGIDATVAAGASIAATAAPAVQATAAAAMGDLSTMLGQSITVRGPVINIFNSMLFTVDDAVGDGNGVLVLVPTGSVSIGQGQQVEVTGLLQQFELSQLEQTLGVDIDDAVAADLSGRPVVIAEQVNTTTAQP